MPICWAKRSLFDAFRVSSTDGFLQIQCHCPRHTKLTDSASAHLFEIGMRDFLVNSLIKWQPDGNLPNNDLILQQAGAGNLWEYHGISSMVCSTVRLLTSVSWPHILSADDPPILSTDLWSNSSAVMPKSPARSFFTMVLTLVFGNPEICFNFNI